MDSEQSMALLWLFSFTQSTPDKQEILSSFSSLLLLEMQGQKSGKEETKLNLKKCS